MDATLQRALKRKGITIKDFKNALELYGFQITVEPLRTSYLKKWTCGTNDKWQIVRECAEKQFGVIYRPGFGWVEKGD